MIRGFADLTPLAGVPSLEDLHPEALRYVTELPPLQKLTRLRRITLQAMNGLTDLSALLTAPALDGIDLALDNLPPEQITQLAATPRSSGRTSAWAATGRTRPSTPACRCHPSPVTASSPPLNATSASSAESRRFLQMAALDQ
jgi:hypothetical protein